MLALLVIPINSIFIVTIPKEDNILTYNAFRPITLCNCLYLIIANIINRRLKPIVSKVISKKQFESLEERQIFDSYWSSI